VTLADWRASRAERKQERPRLRGIRVRDLDVRASTLDGMVLEDVDGLRLDDAEWMLDLTRAPGDITTRGYPSRFIRRNPELHAVVTAAAVSDGAWREVDHGRSALRVPLLELARSGWEDVTFVADPHGRRAEDDLRYLEALRTAGIAEPD
jgi:hypothetical protein